MMTHASNRISLRMVGVRINSCETILPHSFSTIVPPTMSPNRQARPFVQIVTKYQPTPA